MLSFHFYELKTVGGLSFDLFNKFEQNQMS